MRRAIFSSFLITTALSPAFAEAPTPAPASASEEIIVTGAAREKVKLKQSGSAISVLSDKDLETRQTRFVSDVLRDLAGTAVNRSGPFGGSTQLRLRGAEGNHTLVVIDGIKANEPFNGEFDFSGLMADDIARIELIRGQQSALYGSDAIGGVLNVVSAKAAEGFHGSARVEGGSFNTLAGLVRFGYGGEGINITGSYGRFQTSGTPTARGGKENDGYRNDTFRVKAEIDLAKGLTLTLAGRAVNAYGETDPQDFTFGSPTQGLVIDGNEYYRDKARYARAALNLDLYDGAWKQQLEVQGVSGDRRSYAGAFQTFAPKGERVKFGYQSSFFFGTEQSQRVTLAYEHEEETYQNRPTFGPATPINAERSLKTNAYIAEYGGTFGALSVGAAIRHDTNSRFKDVTTWRITAAYDLADWGTRLRARIGTGIKNPTNFELFGYDPGSFIGNPNLKPETSEGWELGLDQSFLGGRGLFSLTYFNARLKDEIFTAFTPLWVSTPGNRTTDSKQRGIEAELRLDLDEAWSVAASYTYLHARENNVGEVRRPANTASLNVTYRFADGLGQVNLGVRHNGSMTDNEFIFATPSTIARLPSFTLVNLSASFKVTETVDVFARAENLLNKRYEEVFSYVAPRAAFYGGVKVSF